MADQVMDDKMVDDDDDFYGDGTSPQKPHGTSSLAQDSAAAQSTQPPHIFTALPLFSPTSIPGLNLSDTLLAITGLPQSTDPPHLEDQTPFPGVINGTHMVEDAPTIVRDAIEVEEKNEEPAKMQLDEIITEDVTEDKAPVSSHFETQQAQAETDEPETRFDSSDLESSSSDDTSSSDSSDEEDDAFNLLDPYEQAKILMKGEEGVDEGGGPVSAPTTKNELADSMAVRKPDVQVTEEMNIIQLGSVCGIVESNTVVVSANTSGEFRVVAEGSVICLDDRTVVGAVADILGKVKQPMYSIRFNSRQDIANSQIDIGTILYYVEQHSNFVFIEPLKYLKGSDASNLYDEEVHDAELEFSDDEAEQEYKRNKKLARRGYAGNETGNQFGGGRDQPPRDHGPPDQISRKNTGDSLNYDDDEEELYRPLTRPDDFDGSTQPSHPDQQSARGRYRDMSHRGTRRGDRGRGQRGGRGRGRGDRHDRSARGPYPDSVRPRSSYSQLSNQSNPEGPHATQHDSHANYSTVMGASTLPQIPPFNAIMQPTTTPNIPSLGNFQAIPQAFPFGPLPLQSPSFPTNLPSSAQFNPAFFYSQQQQFSQLGGAMQSPLGQMPWGNHTNQQFAQQQQTQPGYASNSSSGAPLDPYQWGYPPTPQSHQPYDPTQPDVGDQGRTSPQHQAMAAAQGRLDLLRQLSHSKQAGGSNGA